MEIILIFFSSISAIQRCLCQKNCYLLLLLLNAVSTHNNPPESFDDDENEDSYSKQSLSNKSQPRATTDLVFLLSNKNKDGERLGNQFDGWMNERILWENYTFLIGLLLNV